MRKVLAPGDEKLCGYVGEDPELAEDCCKKMCCLLHIRFVRVENQYIGRWCQGVARIVEMQTSCMFLFPFE